MQWEGRESLVVGIYGPWGSGKTTVKDHVMRALAAEPEASRPLVVQFNPWEWNGSEQVRSAFFEQLAAELKTSGNANALTAADRLSLYGTLLTLGSSLTGSLKTLAPFFVPGSGLALDVLNQTLTKSAELVRNTNVPASQPSLRQMKAELSVAIEKIGCTVVVILDDVDRLSTEEIAQLFALLKVNADFARVVYVVLCDPTVVAKALDDISSGAGAEYLEKIVQVGFHLPHVSPRQLEQMLTDDVLGILREVDLEYAFDRLRWMNVCADGLTRYFETLRDVNRFVASVEFTLGLVSTDGDVAFDLIDFLLLEVLRMFERPLYERLPLLKDRLTGRTRSRSDEDYETFVEGVLAAASNREAADRLLIDMFRVFRAAKKYRGDTGPRRYGVADYDTFDRYFHFAVPSHEYSAEDLEAVIAARSRTDRFFAYLRDAHEGGRLVRLIEELKGRDDLPLDVAAYVTALIDFGEELDSTDLEFEYSAASEFQHLVWVAMRRIPLNRRDDVLREVAGRTRGIWLLGKLVRFRTEESDAEELFSGIVRDDIRQEVERRIRASAHAGDILAHPHSGDLLQWWLESSAKIDAVNYIRKATADDRTAMMVLQAFSTRLGANVGEARKRHHAVNAFADELIEIVGMQTVQKVIASLKARPRQPVGEWQILVAFETAFERSQRKSKGANDE